jgi:hypothetical protein
MPEIDLATEWRSRRWRRLLNLIDHLPRNSHYYQAISDDELFAEQVLDADTPSSQGTRLMTEWTPETEMLTNIYDRLGEQIAVALAVGGAKKPARPKPMVRPKTAMDRVKRKRRERESAALKSKLLPPKAVPTHER